MKFKLTHHQWILDGKILHQAGLTHAQVPKAVVHQESVKLFFASRASGVASVYSIDLKEREITAQIKSISKMRLELSPSVEKGTFDDEGVMPACVIRMNESYYMYYSGWNSRNTVPYHNATGLAVFDRDLILMKRYKGPVFDRELNFPFLAVTPTVFKRKSDLLSCYYINGNGWLQHNGRYEPDYTIRYATSKDGLYWTRYTHDPVQGASTGWCFSNPCHFSIGDESYIIVSKRKMFDFRNNAENGYRLAVYKEEREGVLVECEIEFAQPIQASMMQCYPDVIAIEGKLWCFYNGNGFGSSGIGVGELTIAEQ